MIARSAEYNVLPQTPAPPTLCKSGELVSAASIVFAMLFLWSGPTMHGPCFKTAKVSPCGVPSKIRRMAPTYWGHDARVHTKISNIGLRLIRSAPSSWISLRAPGRMWITCSHRFASSRFVCTMMIASACPRSAPLGKQYASANWVGGPPSRSTGSLTGVIPLQHTPRFSAERAQSSAQSECD